MRGRPIPPLKLDTVADDELLVFIRQWRENPNVAKRAEIVRACAVGWTNRHVAFKLDVSPRTVAKWRSQYLEYGIDGLLDKPRSGRPRGLSDVDQNRVVEFAQVFVGETKWTGIRDLAYLTGCSAATISRVLKSRGIKPWLPTKAPSTEPPNGYVVDDTPSSIGRARDRKSKRPIPRYRHCTCNEPLCPDCNVRKYIDTVNHLADDWLENFGFTDRGRTLAESFHIVLKVRADCKRAPTEWLDRIFGFWNQLKAHWIDKFDSMSPYLKSLQWTEVGTPHLHVAVPTDGLPPRNILLRWLAEKWMTIIGESDLHAQQQFVHIGLTRNVWRLIRYILWDIAFPFESVAPAGVRRYRRWSTSQGWRTEWKGWRKRARDVSSHSSPVGLVDGDDLF